jgi:hypothetical protein
MADGLDGALPARSGVLQGAGDPAGEVAAVGVVPDLAAVAEDVQRILSLEHLLHQVGGAERAERPAVDCIGEPVVAGIPGVILAGGGDVVVGKNRWFICVLIQTQRQAEQERRRRLPPRR